MFQLRLAEARLTKVCPAKIPGHEFRIDESRVFEDAFEGRDPAEVRLAEAGSVGSDAFQAGSGEVRAGKVCVLKLGAVKVCVLQRRPEKADPAKVGVGEVRAGEIPAHEVPVPKNGPNQLCPTAILRYRHRLRRLGRTPGRPLGRLRFSLDDEAKLGALGWSCRFTHPYGIGARHKI